MNCVRCTFPTPLVSLKHRKCLTNYKSILLNLPSLPTNHLYTTPIKIEKNRAQGKVFASNKQLIMPDLDPIPNVFGSPITDGSTRKERADAAVLWENHEGRKDDAIAFVRNLKNDWGTGISTLCILYNATGDNIELVGNYDFHGYIYEPGPYKAYPITISNGQWGAFLHVKTSGTATGSSAAIVYRGRNNAGDVRDWMVSWAIPWIGSNSAYTLVREADYFEGTLANIEPTLDDNDSTSSDEWQGCKSKAVVEDGTSPLFTAILGLTG